LDDRTLRVDKPPLLLYSGPTMVRGPGRTETGTVAKDTQLEAAKEEFGQAVREAFGLTPRSRRQRMPFAVPVVDGDLSGLDKGCILTIGSPGHDDLEVGETVALKDATNQLWADAKVLELTPDPRFELLEQPSKKPVGTVEDRAS
jgi:hypothetical protein